MTRVEPRDPLIKPPALRTGEPASASRLELFFDLAYVLVVLDLATTFLGDLSWHGLGTFAALYVALWFSWLGFTLYVNRFDTDEVIFRIAKLAATLAIAGCARGPVRVGSQRRLVRAVELSTSPGVPYCSTSPRRPTPLPTRPTPPRPLRRHARAWSGSPAGPTPTPTLPPPCLLPPEWSGGYTSLLALQQQEQRGTDARAGS